MRLTFMSDNIIFFLLFRSEKNFPFIVLHFLLRLILDSSLANQIVNYLDAQPGSKVVTILWHIKMIPRIYLVRCKRVFNCVYAV